MSESNLEQDVTSSVKTHEEILEMIEEIKEFEKKFREYDLEETEVEEELIEVEQNIVDFIEVDKDESDQIEPIAFESEAKKSGFIERLIKSKIFRIRVRSRSEAQKARLEAKAATFKLRLNEEGKLVNIDLKKPKSSKPKSKKRFNLKKIVTKRRGKTKETEVETTEKMSKISKLKGGFSKISKLKRAIPHKGKMEKKSEESESEE